MRHHKSGRKLNRNSSSRDALFKSLAVSLFRYEQINTTVPKAKELRRFAEPLITLAKVSSVANRRLAFSRLQDREIVTKLFDELGTRYKERPGGYMRILKNGFRAGDTAPMAVVQLVDRPEVIADANATEGDADAVKAAKKAAKPKAEKKPKEPKAPKAEKPKVEKKAKPKAAAKSAPKKAKPKAKPKAKAKKK